MKTIAATLLLFAATMAHASPGKYTEVDYDRQTENNSIVVKIASKQVNQELNTFGLSCAKAALASVIGKVFELSENDGVDYPETLFVKSANALQPVPWVSMLEVETDDGKFQVSLGVNSEPCIANEAVVQ